MARLNGHNVLTVVRTAYLNVAEAYPIGSIYMSINSTSPASLFGGTWERISDKFLYGAATDNELGNTGGEATHQLTVNEMPNHRHLTAIWEGSHTASSLANSGWGERPAVNMTAATARQDLPTLYTSQEGLSQAHNNMPPYIKVAIWKRTA